MVTQKIVSGLLTSQVFTPRGTLIHQNSGQVVGSHWNGFRQIGEKIRIPLAFLKRQVQGSGIRGNKE